MDNYESVKRKLEELHDIKPNPKSYIISSNDCPCGNYSKIVEVTTVPPEKNAFYFKIPFNPDTNELLFEKCSLSNTGFKSAILVYSDGKHAIFRGYTYISQFFSLDGGIEKIWFVEIETKKIIKKIDAKFISLSNYNDEVLIMLRLSNGMVNYFNICGEKLKFLHDFYRIDSLGKWEFFKNEIGIISAYNPSNHTLFSEAFQSFFKIRKDKACVQRISGEWCYIDTDYYQVYPVTSKRVFKYMQFFTEPHADDSSLTQGYIVPNHNIMEIPDTAKAFVYFESPYDFKKVPDTKFLGNRYNFSTIFCVEEHELCEMEFKRRKVDPAGAITDIVPGLPVELISAKKQFNIIPEKEFINDQSIFIVSSEI